LYDAHLADPKFTKWKLVCKLDTDAGRVRSIKEGTSAHSFEYKLSDYAVDLEGGGLRRYERIDNKNREYHIIKDLMKSYRISETEAQIRFSARKGIRTNLMRMPKNFINRCAVEFTRRRNLAVNLISGAEQGIFPQGLRKHGT
jgi:hypothetical protein